MSSNILQEELVLMRILKVLDFSKRKHPKDKKTIANKKMKDTERKKSLAFVKRISQAFDSSENL